MSPENAIQDQFDAHQDALRAMAEEFPIGSFVHYASASYEVADIKPFPHGIMIGIYDEPPSKHVDYLRPEALEKVIRVSGKLTPLQRDKFTAALKWIDRIADRKDMLPASFMDGCDPSPLAKSLRAILNEDAS